MAEDKSGKGIALVILGIVAIIAIVGLVLLFTGYKGAAGQFAVPAAKEYGGAVKGVIDPYSHAFAGRSNYYASGSEPEIESTEKGGSRNAQGDELGPGGLQAVGGQKDALPQSAVFFQASQDYGNVHVGDNCYYDPAELAAQGISRNSDAGFCADMASQGYRVNTIRANCNGDVSKARTVQGGYGSDGQGPVFQDMIEVPVGNLGWGCAYVSPYRQNAR